MTTRILTNSQTPFSFPDTARRGDVVLRLTLLGPDQVTVLPVLSDGVAPMGAVELRVEDMVDGVFSLDLQTTDTTTPETVYQVEMWQTGLVDGQQYHHQFTAALPDGPGDLQWSAFQTAPPPPASEWNAFFQHATGPDGLIDAAGHLTQADRDAIAGIDSFTLTAGETLGGDKVLELAAGTAILADHSSTPAGAVLGFSAGAAVQGELVTIRRSGLAGISGLTADQRYYLGIAGGLTETPPATGLVQAVGQAQSNSQLSIQLGAAYARAN